MRAAWQSFSGAPCDIQDHDTIRIRACREATWGWSHAHSSELSGTTYCQSGPSSRTNNAITINSTRPEMQSNGDLGEKHSSIIPCIKHTCNSTDPKNHHRTRHHSPTAILFTKTKRQELRLATMYSTVSDSKPRPDRHHTCLSLTKA